MKEKAFTLDRGKRYLFYILMIKIQDMSIIVFKKVQFNETIKSLACILLKLSKICNPSK